MKDFFGVPMQNIALTLAFLLIAVMVVIVFLAFRNRILVKLALRNIPRRPAQTILIIIGLMLSTTIISASLAIGDTVAGTIRGTVLDALGETDLTVQSSTANTAFGDNYLTPEQQQQVMDTTAGDDRIDGVLPEIRETLPVLDERSQLTEARMIVAGFDASRTDGFGSVTSTSGEDLTIASLGPNEVFLNEKSAEEIDAQAGDALTVVTPTGRHPFTVRAVVKEGGLAANDKRLLMRLDSMQDIMDRAGQVNRIDISLRGTGESGLSYSGDVADELRIAFTDPTVAESLFTTLKEPAVIQAIEDRISQNPGNTITPAVKKDLQALVTELQDNTSATDKFRSLIVDTQVAGQVLASLDGAGLSSQIVPVTTQLGQVELLSVNEIKQGGLDLATIISSFVTSLFTVFGSFSIIVGLLLIFLVFVMLAAARSNEMGIARAVGTKRRHLVEMFTFEGVAYSVGAAVVGTIIGLIASRVLVQLLISAVGAGNDDFTFHYSITFYSVVAGFCLGLLLTLITVGVSAYRVSKLNIVVAIRGLPAEFEKSETPPFLKRLLHVLQAVLGPVYYLYRAIKLGRRGDDITRPVLLFFLMFLIIPWVVNIVIAIYKVFSPYLSQGWPLIIIGALIAVSGISADLAFLWTLGVSMLLVGVGLLVRAVLHRATTMRRSTTDRIGFTLMGGLVLAFWCLPFTTFEGLTGELNAGIEMFILSGVWMVASAVWLVMYNADILMAAIQGTLGRITRLRPILKPAIAYPMGARFRTGLTVAMFALVIFTMMVFSILNNLGNDIVDTPDKATGGFDIRAETAENLPITDMRSQIEAAPNLDINDFEVIAADREISAEARQADADEKRFLSLGVRGADNAYLQNVDFELTHYDPSYLPAGVDTNDAAAVSRALWDRLAEDPSLAVITTDRLEVSGGGDFTFGEAPFRVEGVKAADPREIEAFTVDVRQPRGRSEATPRTVIAVIDPTAGLYEGSADQEGPFSGIMTSSEIFNEISDQPVPLTTFRIRLAPGVDAGRTAAAMETAFLDNSLQATDTLQEIKDGISANNAFGRLFQGFMGLGLVVGVAALGVLSFRAVVERRHSIGMMRAVGYKSRMIQTQFLIESVFITVLGSALGLVLGMWLSKLLLDSFRAQAGDVAYAVPWATVTVILVIALLASLATTFIPARQASRIYPSEALRYE